MGLGIEVLIVDWPRVEAAAPGDRDDLLTDAAFDENGEDDRVRHGWSWSTRPGEDWYGRYAFRKSGSYKPHFWAGQYWEAMREAVEPSMREVLDQFNDALFWHGLEDTPGVESVLPERPHPWDAELLLWCLPDDVPHLARWWRQASPRLEVLREPFARHAAKPGGYFPTFESFAEFLAEWGDVVTEAERQGWGIVGLRC